MVTGEGAHRKKTSEVYRRRKKKMMRIMTILMLSQRIFVSDHLLILPYGENIVVTVLKMSTDVFFACRSMLDSE